MSDDAKRWILARRARFVATAIAGLTVGACDSCDSKHGTTTETPTTASTSTGPAACLKPAVCLSPPRPPSGDADGAAAAASAMLKALAELDGAGPTPRGEVTTTTAVTGAVPRAEATVRAGFALRARTCYRQALASDPQMAGRAVIALKVAPGGDVDSASVTSATGLSTQLTACLVNAARKLHFEGSPGTDASAAGIVTITAALTVPD